MQEPVLAIVHNLKEVRQFGGPRTFNMVVTRTRCLFAHMTDEMQRQALADAREAQEAGTQEPGLFRQAADETSVAFAFGDRYRNMAPQAILAEDPVNFAIESSNITALVFKKRHTGAGPARKMVCELTVESRSSTLTYLIDWYPEQDIKATKAVFGQKVKAE